MTEPIAVPDLSSRPYRLTVEREMQNPPAVLYEAWTRLIDHWCSFINMLEQHPNEF